MEIITQTEKETIGIAKEFASQLESGEVLGLVGDLGAGKTCFTKGLAQGLRIKKNITSPTFVLMKVYPVKHKTIKNFVHIDAYRLRSYNDLLAIGIEDYISKDDSVVIIEWADRIKDKKVKIKNIKFEIKNNFRIINI